MYSGNRDKDYKELLAMTELQLKAWLLREFTPERYRAGNKDIVEPAYNLLLSQYPNVSSLKFVEALWVVNQDGEPDSIPHFDGYGRLTCFTPNWKKPGVSERVMPTIHDTEDNAPKRR